jgi:thioredoxin reductase
VLDLVENKSRVLRFEDCIQCEACMFACPTEALVMFPEGGTPPPLKIPDIDDNFQTAVPGQYLIGEVAGKPLVKNAANLGRAVVEHMLVSGLRPGRSNNMVDVAIVGSGPGGLSAALTCVQRGLSYIVLEKEQLLASTIARYPKGKLVMAEPYDTQNLSLLPVFDSSKEQLIPIWTELIDRIGLRINKGESVEAVQVGHDGMFDVRTTVGQYRAQRVVLSIGTRGKPRTLQVPGENLPKVFSLLEDPDEWRGKNVLVVGGGDSACEAALALSDSGARVMVSYRGKGFNRAAPKNKQGVESYAQQGRIKVKLGSQVLQFDHESVTMALGDGTQKRYPNDGAFVLIGADPPVQWLEKMGIRFVQRPHQHQMGKTDDVVRRFIMANDCPEDAARAAAQVLGGSMGKEPARPAMLPMPIGQPVSGPRKWLRSATSIFSLKDRSRMTPLPIRSEGKGAKPAGSGGGKKLDGPMPLSEFAKRQRQHTGHGRRDALSAGERTRILRMLRDEGGRMADEDSQVFMGAPPVPKFDFDFDEGDAAPAAPPRSREMPAAMPDMPAKPAVVVGLAQARKKGRVTGGPQPSQRPPIPPSQPPPPPSRAKPVTAPPPLPVAPKSKKRQLPKPFEDPTRAVNDQELLKAVRSAPGPGRVFEEPTRMGDVDARLLDQGAEDIETRTEFPPKFLQASTEPAMPPVNPFDESTDESTRLANVEGIAKMERDRAKQPRAEERTRAVDIRQDPSMSEIDWDID